jgi:hypothetical protein
MPNLRRNPRGRNSKKELKNIIEFKPFLIAITVIISVLILILVFKNHERNVKALIGREERETELYLLFQELDLAVGNFEQRKRR